MQTKQSELLLRRALNLLHRWTLRPELWTKAQRDAVACGRDPLTGLYRYFFREDGLPKTLTCAELIRSRNLTELNEFVLLELCEAERNIRGFKASLKKGKAA